MGPCPVPVCGHKARSVSPLPGTIRRDWEPRTTAQDLCNCLNKPHMLVILVLSLLESHGTPSALRPQITRRHLKHHWLSTAAPTLHRGPMQQREGRGYNDVGLKWKKKDLYGNVLTLVIASILIAHLTETVTDHSKVPRSAGNKHDLCGQEFGTTVMWHFCLCSDGKTLHNTQIAAHSNQQ